MEDLYSVNGNKFQYEKYLPKIEYIKNYFVDDWQNRKVLDVGIGYGYFLHILEKNFKFKHIYGMDPYLQSITISQKYTSATLKEGKIEDKVWPFSNRFDVITCFDVIEHLENPADFFRNAKRYLKNDGIIIVSTPNKQIPYYMRSIPIFGLPDKNPTHIHVESPHYWFTLAKGEKLEVIKTWKGEHLTHLKILPKIVSRICALLKIDHREMPIINAFEQSFVMVLK